MTKAIGLKRNEERKRNYKRGRFGNKRSSGNFNFIEKIIIRLHLFSDKLIAKWTGSSTNGIQTMRWRLKNNYKGMYKQ